MMVSAGLPRSGRMARRRLNRAVRRELCEKRPPIVIRFGSLYRFTQDSLALPDIGDDDRVAWVVPQRVEERVLLDGPEVEQLQSDEAFVDGGLERVQGELLLTEQREISTSRMP